MAGVSGCDDALKSISLCRPAAEQTHMTIPVLGALGGSIATTATWRILVSLHLGDFKPTMADFLPQPECWISHIAVFLGASAGSVAEMVQKPSTHPLAVLHMPLKIICLIFDRGRACR